MGLDTSEAVSVAHVEEIAHNRSNKELLPASLRVRSAAQAALPMLHGECYSEFPRLHAARDTRCVASERDITPICSRPLSNL